VAAGCWVRLKLEDTSLFRELEEAGLTEHETTTEFKDLLHYWRPMVKLAVRPHLLEPGDRPYP
jgi:MFS transporter, MHS family, proline/betaine transporter